MIPISEIQRVIDDLTHRSGLCKMHGSYNRADAYEVAISKLKELIPSEVSNTGNTSKPE